MTKAQIIAYTGGDYDDNVMELAREQELANSAGIALDKDILDAAAPAPTPDTQPDAAVVDTPTELPARAKRTRRAKTD